MLIKLLFYVIIHTVIKMRDNENSIVQQLYELQDLKYRDFHAKLIPNIEKEKIIGIRTPELRRFATELIKNGEAQEFINTLPHFYFDENNLHAFIISKIKDYNEAVKETEKFLPFVDNWATCDQLLPKVFAKNTDRLILKIQEWIKSDKTYTVRFAIGMLLKYFLGSEFDEKYLKLVSEVKSEEYYINMMIAWFFAEALAKQYDSALPYIEKNALGKKTNNKAIQKAVESFRISDEKKAYLKTLKIK